MIDLIAPCSRSSYVELLRETARALIQQNCRESTP
jgi:hypothetical protein